MHPSQRAHRQPPYVHEYDRYLKAILLQVTNYNKQFKQVDQELAKEMDLWDQDSKRVHEQTVKGIILDSFQRNNLDRRLEQLTVRRVGYDNAKKQILFNVESGVKVLLQYFDDISDDYLYKFLTEEEYQKYLKNYEEVFEAVKGLISYTSPVMETIKKAIEKHLK